MHSGKFVPSPTMKLAPHAFAPNNQSRCAVAKAWYAVLCVAASYIATVEIRPKVWESTSKLS